MKIIILLLSISVQIFFPAAAPAEIHSAWKESLYRTFSCEDFDKYPPANRAIEFSDIDYPLLRAAIFFELNTVRKGHRKPPFHYSRALEKAASMHSKDMTEMGFFSHISHNEAKRRTPEMRMAMFGVRKASLAENIALAFGIRYESGSKIIPPGPNEPFRDSAGRVIRHHTYSSFAKKLVESWMNSHGHRENILNRDLSFVGLGASHFKDKSFYNIDTFKVTLDLSSTVPE